jgi:hypothetical protein
MSEGARPPNVSTAIDRMVTQDDRAKRRLMWVTIVYGAIIVILIATLGLVQVTKQNNEHRQTTTEEAQIISLLKGHSSEFADIKALLEHQLATTSKAAKAQGKAEIKGVVDLVVVCINNYARRSYQSTHNQLESPLAKGCPYVPVPQPNRHKPPPPPHDPNR